MSWEPSTDLEELIVSLQPDHDYIFTNKPVSFCPRPQAHIDCVTSRKKKLPKANSRDWNSQKLEAIATVQDLTNIKPLGELPSNEDWNDRKTAEQETIVMMRKLGIGPSIDEPLDSSCTIASYPVTKKIHISRNGLKRLPIIYDDEFFKLKPTSPSSMIKSDHSEQEDVHNKFISVQMEKSDKKETKKKRIYTPQELKAESSYDSSLESTFETHYVRLGSHKPRNNSSNKIFFTAKEIYDKKRGRGSKSST